MRGRDIFRGGSRRSSFLTQPDLDYDLTEIPAAYDRGRDHGPEVLDLWMNVVASHCSGIEVTRILDLGCGTGRFSAGLARRFEAEVVGLDPSDKMLSLARSKGHPGRVLYQRGGAEAIPLPTAAVDLIFMSMSFHHFNDPAIAARECRRVLRPDGRVIVRTGTRERIMAYPYVRFFPSSPKLIEEVLPDAASLRSPFEAAGFRLVAHDVVTQVIAPDWMSYADKLAAGADSVLARLSTEEFQAGLADLRARMSQGNPGEVVEPIDLFVLS